MGLEQKLRVVGVLLFHVIIRSPVERRFGIASQVQKEYFGVALANQTPVCHALWFYDVRIWFHVSLVEKLALETSASPLQRTTSSLDVFRCWCFWRRISSNSFRISARCRLRLPWLHPSANVIWREMPRSITPLDPVRFIKRPLSDQLSNQKDMLTPLFTSTLHKFLAVSRCFNSLLHIQDPNVECDPMDQRDSLLSRFILVHFTHKESWEDNNRHISFTLLTSFASRNDRKPRPPSFFGMQISSQETFALFGFSCSPDHKNVELI